jgi:enoyl-CoA hydratase/carnithine racemase
MSSNLTMSSDTLLVEREDAGGAAGPERADRHALPPRRRHKMPFAEAAIYEATPFGLVAATDDMREGTRALLEKRKPDFKGR